MPSEGSKRGLKTQFVRVGASICDSFGYVSYKILALVSLVVLKLFFRLEVKGRQNIPGEGPIILAANHFSIIDPWVLQVSFPRRITYMVEDEYYQSWGWWFYRMHRAIPVKTGGFNKEAVVTGLKALKNNGVLGIFPEGWGEKVDGKVGQGSAGVAMLSCKSRAPVLPIYIDGVYEALPKGAILPRFTRMTVKYGKPVRCDIVEKPDKETLRRMTDEIMDKIRELAKNGE